MILTAIKIIAQIGVALIGAKKPKQHQGRPANLGAGWHYFSPDDFVMSDIASRHGLDNEPTYEAWENIDHIVLDFLDELRESLGKPIIVTSGYRSPQVNAVAKGSKNSQHMRGEAVDIRVVGMSQLDLYRYIVEGDIAWQYDQCIYEHNLVHVSRVRKRKNRKQALVERKNRRRGQERYVTYRQGMSI